MNDHTNVDIVTRLREAYDNMGTGTRDDLKDAADEIEKWRRIAEGLYKAACGHERPMPAVNAYMKEMRKLRA